MSTVVIAVVLTALVFDFTNGFHDTANAMATSIATGALRPRVAVLTGRGAQPGRGVPVGRRWPRPSPAGWSTRRGSPRR